MPVGLSTDSVGPVDVAVIVFEGSEFNGEVAPALIELHENGTIRVIDVAFVHKEADGTLTVLEATDAGVSDAFAGLTGSQYELLSDADLEDLAVDLAPGSSEMIIVWENTWAARFAVAVRKSRGEVVLLERIPRDIVLGAIGALDLD